MLHTRCCISHGAECRLPFLTLLWISSLTEGKAPFSFFTSSSSTRGLIVIPWKPDDNLLSKQKTNLYLCLIKIHEGRFSPHLHKDSEEDDHDGGGDEESFLWEVVDQEDEGKADGPSQASVGDDELVSEGHGVPPQLVHHGGQQENTFRGNDSC